MKQITMCVLAVAIFASQDSISQEQVHNRIGIGMSIEPALFGSSLLYYTTAYGPDGYYIVNQSAYQASPINVYLPINVTPTFRLEPVFGIYLFRNEHTIITTYKSEVTLTHLALGGFYLIPTNTNLQMYVGPRIGLNFVTSLSTDYYYPGLIAVQRERKTTQTDVVAGLNFGGEFYASPAFSIGGEIDANYVFYGNPDVSYTPPQTGTSTTERKQHVIATGALFFLRWYFGSGE
jgi:hypothetical protein